jgi:diaminohydroxyphosphoribosylaminopyrimidine deaminase / 5-amino-6-(5-phosphoribosylamino)uracil reductase
LTDEEYMQRAIELALRGSGWVDPNPLVGAVVVREGRIIGEGWHPAFGELHAERQALADCRQRGEETAGATIYVTLEPCCHTGKTPPCTEAIIEAGISRVVMGAPDPNPKVDGGGIAQLEAAGIEVVQGVLVEECREVNKAFFHYIETGKPYVVLKYAMTLDGKIATRSGKSKWITGPAARRRVHEDRQRYAAIMVGVNTVIKDDPQLTCRLDDFAPAEAEAAEQVSEERYEAMLEQELAEDEAILEGEGAAEAEGSALRGYGPFRPRCSNPIRIICDTHLRTPLNSQVVRTAATVPTYIATAETDLAKHLPYRERECDIIVVPEAAGHIDLEVLMEKLGKMGIDSVIVEGGAEVNWSVLAYEVVSKVQCYVAPKIFGGAQAPSPVAGFGVEAPKYAIELTEPKVTQLGSDLLIECEVR